MSIIFLAGAAALAIGAGTGVIGKWGYLGAVICVLLLVNVVAVGAVFKLIGLAFKLLPVILIGVGILAVLKVFGKS